MANQLNSGSLDTLKAGQTLLQFIRKVDNGKFQCTLIDRVSTSSNDLVVGDEEMIDGLAELNYGDDRFNNTSDYYVQKVLTEFLVVALTSMHKSSRLTLQSQVQLQREL